MPDDIQQRASTAAQANAQNAILDCLERFSLQQFNNHVRGAAFSRLDKEEDLSADHWVASVLLNTPKAQVLLRVHFSSAVGRLLLANAIQEDATALQPTSAHDFLKEYCNVVMGKIKAILLSEAGKSEAQKVFLPHIEPSYDCYGKVPEGGEKAVEQRWWRLSWTGGHIILFGRATATEGFTSKVLEELAHTQILSVDDGGEIDFF